MFNLLANNTVAFCLGLVVAVALWIVAGKIKSENRRLLARTTVAFLACPVFYLGHPFMYGSFWMLVVVAVSEPRPAAFGFLGVVWTGFFLAGKVASHAKRRFRSNAL